MVSERGRESMYNRYFGNTGKYVRVEDVDDLRPLPPEIPLLPAEPEEPILSPVSPMPPVEPSAWQALLSGLGSGGKAESRTAGEKPKFDLDAVFQAPAHLREAVKGRMPEAFDFGDILLVLVLLYLFLEGEEDEMLIVLGVLIVLWILPLFGKEDS